MSGHFKAFRKRSRTGGFTLLEIVVVLILLGILASVAIAHYFDVSEEAAQKAAQAAVAEIQARIDSEFTTRIVRGEKCSVAREYASNLANVADSVGSGAVATASDDETGSADRVLKFGEFTVTDSSAWNSGQKKITVTIETHTFRQQGPLIQPTCEDTDESSSSGDSSSGGGSDSGSGGGTDTGGTDTDSGDNSGTDTGDKGTGDDDDDGDSGSNPIITELEKIGAASYEEVRSQFDNSEINMVQVNWRDKNDEGFLFSSTVTSPKSYYVTTHGFDFCRKHTTLEKSDHFENNPDLDNSIDDATLAVKLNTDEWYVAVEIEHSGNPSGQYAYYDSKGNKFTKETLPKGTIAYVTDENGNKVLYALIKDIPLDGTSSTNSIWIGGKEYTDAFCTAYTPITTEKRGIWLKINNPTGHIFTYDTDPFHWW